MKNFSCVAVNGDAKATGVGHSTEPSGPWDVKRNAAIATASVTMVT
jgi:hypothetical protein